MEYTRWTEMLHMPPPNPNPNPPPPRDLYSHHPYTTRYPSHYSLNPQNSNPNPNRRLPIDLYASHETLYRIGRETGLRRPGIDPYHSLSPLLHRHGGGYEVHSSNVAYARHTTIDAGSMVVPSAYYQEPSGSGVAHNWGTNELVRRYATGVTISPNGAEELVPYPNSALRTNASVHPRRNESLMRGPKNMNAVQSARCEVCKIECTSKDDLDHHISGKKHKKNLEMRNQGIAPGPTAPARRSKRVSGAQGNHPVKGKAIVGQKTKRTADHRGDGETKRRKILKCGTPAVKKCTICNVVCNSEIVFGHHMAGSKHAAMMKKHAAGSGLATIH
ncbi:uncharacterized protein LOC132315967 [Cornus florida]|uniref:uncharacterized protein LOC132315967 n=1 Tax=Cornus florida TaxID=4283 RepID=UPI0028A032FE|nr:uncharacterized protein LOC132315967 [Cornus florida]